MKILHFKSEDSYRKWSSYGSTRIKSGLPVKVSGNQRIYIGGKLHKVSHK